MDGQHTTHRKISNGIYTISNLELLFHCNSELIHHYPQQLIPFPNNTAKFLSSIKRPGSTVIVLYVTRWLVTVKVRDRT
ncbi:hypothetical protein M8J75_015004 [Diaphorina citri]|nr:hypothetical protein M8J75_015004 [Diaphorina citri]